MICVSLDPPASSCQFPLFIGSDVESHSLWVFHSGGAILRVSTLIYKTVTLSVLLESVPKRPQPIPISKSSYLIPPYMTCAVHMGLLHNLINHCALGGFFKALKIDQISFNYSGLFGIIASKSSLEIHFPAQCSIFPLPNLGTVTIKI